MVLEVHDYVFLVPNSLAKVLYVRNLVLIPIDYELLFVHGFLDLDEFLLDSLREVELALYRVVVIREFIIESSLELEFGEKETQLLL